KRKSPFALGAHSVWGLDAHLLCSLPDLNVGLRALGRHLLLSAVDGGRSSDGNDAVSRGLGLETKDADHARTAHAGCSRRAGGVDRDAARLVVTVDQCDCLTIAAEEVPVVHIDQGKLGRIVLNLQRYGSNIRCATEDNWH